MIEKIIRYVELNICLIGNISEFVTALTAIIAIIYAIFTLKTTKKLNRFQILDELFKEYRTREMGDSIRVLWDI